MTETFEAFVQLNEHAKWRVPNDATTNQIADHVICEELVPYIRLQLLHAERQTMVLRINVEDHRIDSLTLLQYLGWMLDPPRRNIGDMHKPVDSLFDFNEGAKVGEIANPATDHR